MKIVKFLNYTWQEIPGLENPAMRCNMIKDQSNFGVLIHPECIMIFKGRREAYQITNGGFVVAHVPKEGDIVKLGVFWTHENAELFAEIVAEGEAPELFSGTNESLGLLSIRSKGLAQVKDGE